MPVFELTELQYREPGDGPWKMYLYREDGYHMGAKWLRKGELNFPDEEITIDRARELATVNILMGLEVRITDGGDNLVFHSQHGQTVYGKNFWSEVNSKKMNRSKTHEEKQ